MDDAAARLSAVLPAHGHQLGALLGTGAEGSVWALGDELVAKAWHGRTAADLEALRDFTAALDAAALPFATPLVIEVIESDGLLVSIERRLRGVPLRTGRPSAPPVTEDECSTMLGVLSALSAIEPSTGLARLPLLPREVQPDGDPFPVRLARLIERRTREAGAPLRAALTDADRLAAAVAGRLRDLAVPRVALVHGDLIPGNVLVDHGRVTAILDFGFLTAIGDPRFDAAVTASVFDMYGRNARASERLLDTAFAAEFGSDPDVIALYRAAYALATATWFGGGPDDGHLAWCARMLERPDVRAAALG